jgi:hypothetical protein
VNAREWIARVALTLVGAAVGLMVGLAVGDSVSPLLPDGDTLAGIAYIAAGGAVGLVLGALVGGFLLRPGARRRARALLGFVAGTFLALVGAWFIGDFTNADGPGGVGPYLGILLLPAGVIVIILSARATLGAERRVAPPFGENGSDHTKEVRR